MKEHPIIFSTPMVQAILKGQKTQTRRIITPLRSGQCETANKSWLDWDSVFPNNPYGIKLPSKIDETVHRVYPPYKPGDLLWVRETVKLGAWEMDDGRMAFDYKASPEIKKTPWVTFEDDHKGEKFIKFIITTCDELEKKHVPLNKDGEYYWEPGKSPLRWKPSIHMPKAAARIWLRITAVRVERLQDISESDAIAEGFRKTRNKYEAEWVFSEYWEELHGGKSWESNPWVWVIEFEVISTIGKPKTLHHKP